MKRILTVEDDDTNMYLVPGIDGIETARRINKFATKQTPIVALPPHTQ